MGYFDRVVHAAQANKIIDEQTQLNQEEKDNFIKMLKLSSNNYCKFIIIDETKTTWFRRAGIIEINI